MIKAGIAGLGRWGQVLVNSVHGKSDRIAITAGCTGRKARAEAFCAEKGIDLRDGLADLLNDPDLDAVILATPHSQHADQVVAASAAGKHVFIEKPFTLDRASAQAAADAAGAAGVVLAFGHNRRFHPAMARMKEMVQSGELGQILHVEGNLSSPSAMRYPEGGWRSSSDESPAGGMTGMGIHVVDAMINLLGPVDEVIARSYRRFLKIDVDDTTAMLFRFASGAMGYLGTFTATAPLWRIQVFGTGGWAEMHNYDRLTVRKVSSDGTVGAEEVTEYGAFDMERAELEAFADACEGRAAYPLPPAEAVHGTAVLEAVIKSAAGGRPVKLKDV
ncbi:MAG: gfo/Idh/MocA family oxidoreductase [Rhodospirillales bacterium CG15_BIG_FIL_POST_REV_8_21_14_020_66_15]|nr:MAG: gfo/Idh/MocA family oxidoreductase [Rhodospirillales bacterium CG15_BIG_FIL_POST_REV_8_21_14_020_66_15]